MYQLYKTDKSLKEANAALLLNGSQNISFLFDPANTDYQAYLAWLEEGNTPLPAEEEDTPTVTWEQIRAKRDQLIRESDWTMIQGATVDQRSWSAYRQVLRDLPQTYPTPESVIWPEPPSTAGPNTNLE